MVAVGFSAGVGDMIALAIEADDEHGPAVEIAAGLFWSDYRGFIALRSYVANAFAEAASAELVGTTKEVDGIICVVGGDASFHGAEMFVT